MIFSYVKYSRFLNEESQILKQIVAKGRFHSWVFMIPMEANRLGLGSVA